MQHFIYSWIIAAICKILFYTKTFPTRTFEKCIMSSILLNFRNPSWMVSICSKEWKHEFVKYIKYTWKCLVLRTQSNMSVGTFFAIQQKKSTIFNWVLNTPLKLWTVFTFINWLWFGWINWRFSISFMSTFIQIFPTFIWEKKSSNLMFKTK